jgi:cytochrome c5
MIIFFHDNLDNNRRLPLLFAPMISQGLKMKNFSVATGLYLVKKIKKNRIINIISYTFLGMSVSCLVFAQPSEEHLLSHIGKYPNYPKINYGSGPQAELIKKGEYLAQAGDCIACHTKPGGLPFAGDLPISTPFGILYSPNITSDIHYGIGNWTLAQFKKAMREGVAPDGSNYFPVFPYPYFNKLTDADIAALKAYFDAVPPIPQPNKPVDMPIPFRWRFMQFFWKLMFFDFKKGVFKPDPQQSAQWNRGAYFVQGLGHCGMCHTPLNALGAPNERYALTGGFGSGSYAPNISFSRFVNISASEIANVFVNNKLITGGHIIGPMAEVVHDSLEYLTKEDLQAIAAYLKSVKSDMPPAKITKITDQTGQKIYDRYCVGCHGIGAGGAPKMGDANDWAPKIKQGKATLYTNAIQGIGNMPPRGTCSTCSDAEIQAAVDYIVKNSQAATTPATKQAPVPRPTENRGKKVYDEVCSICHSTGKLGAPVLGDQESWAPIIKKNMDVLVEHTLKGYKNMPAKGACYQCSDTDLIAAVIYMVNQSQSGGNYHLW